MFVSLHGGSKYLTDFISNSDQKFLMEQFESKSLSKIFKFSNISCILVYYGLLHEWKTLMESLNTETNKTWRDNLEAFIKCGENHKSQFFLDTESQRFESFILNINYNNKFISGFLTYIEWIKKFYPAIMNALNNDKKLLVFQSENKTNDNLIIDNYCFNSIFVPKMDLFICSEGETLNLIPIMRCPNFKHEYYNSFDDLLSSIMCKPKLSLFTLLLKKYKGTIKYQKIRNQIYDFDQEAKCEYYKSDCQIKNCSCKPTIVKNISESQLEDLSSTIQQGLISSNVSRFCIKIILFSIDLNDSFFDYYCELKNVLKLLDIGERSSIEFESIWINYYKMLDSQTELIPNSKNIIFCFGGKLYKIHCNESKPKLKGLIYEPNNKSSVIFVKCDYFNADNVVITYEDDVSCFQSEWYDQLLGDDSTQNKLSLHFVLNKSDITCASYYQIESMKKICTFPNLKKVIIKAAEKNFKKVGFIDALKYIQKSITLRIECKKDSWFLTNESFWKMLFKFKAAELVYNYFEIIIDCQDQKLSQTNILKSKVIVFINGNKEIIEIRKVINMFKDYYKKNLRLSQLK